MSRLFGVEKRALQSSGVTSQPQSAAEIGTICPLIDAILTMLSSRLNSHSSRKRDPNNMNRTLCQKFKKRLPRKKKSRRQNRSRRKLEYSSLLGAQEKVLDVQHFFGVAFRRRPPNTLFEQSYLGSGTAKPWLILEARLYTAIWADQPPHYCRSVTNPRGFHFLPNHYFCCCRAFRGQQKPLRAVVAVFSPAA